MPAILAPPPDLQLLLIWPQRRPFRSWMAIGMVAAVCQGLFFTGLLMLASVPPALINRNRAAVRVTPLYLPPDLLTQKAPNRTKPATDINLADLQPSRRAMPSKPSPPPSTRHMAAPSPPPVSAQPAPATNIKESVQLSPAKVATSESPALPLPPPANAPPPLRPSKATLDNAIRSLAQAQNSPGMTVNDSVGRATPGIPGTTNQAGSQHVEVELKSDADAPDFREYLARILSVVRANWRRVTPESVRMGTLRGENTVELVINRDGSIPKLVMGQPSNIDALDRASVAGVSMSNPLPPLPDNFKGQQVRLAFTFKYNIQE